MHKHHTIDYIEFSVRNLAEAKQFFTAAFDWKFSDYGPKYAGIQSSEPGREVGGLCEGDAPRGSGPLVVLFSDDLDATRRAVEAAGGSVSKEPFTFPGGRRFHFKDPSGNELAVWSK